MVKPSKKEILERARKIKMIIFDFDGVFTDNRVLVFEDGKEAVFCNRGDGHGLKLLKETGISILVLSTEANPVVNARCKKLNLRCVQACENKLKVLENEIQKFNLKADEIAYLGNDVNDLECLRAVGFAACVADAHSSVLKCCIYKTASKGGNGAVREFCDFIMEANNKKG